MKKKNKVALITGVTGQDGSYLAEFLLKKNYYVHGIKRKSSSFNTYRIDHIFEKNKKKFFLHYGDVTDNSSLTQLIEKIKPDEIYNLAAQSHVGTSFLIPEYTADVVALGTLRILEIIKNKNKKIRFYQASSSEMFGDTKKIPQNENTIFKPMSPYSISKVFAHNITKNYREAYGIFASNGILFNHESPRRGETFVTRKITRGLARIISGHENMLYLGNLNSKRDWGHALDYVEMMWKILQFKKPDDFVVASGKQITVRKFLEKSLDLLNIKYKWKKDGKSEKVIITENHKIFKNIIKGKILVSTSSRYLRPLEVSNLKGDSSKARKLLKWKPRISLEKMITEMIREEFKQLDSNVKI